MAVHLGISLWPQSTSWASLRDAGLVAERAGLDSLYTWDHFYAIVGDPYAPNLEGWQVLPAWGALTERIKIGMLVTGITYRHPAVLVKMATALDHITSGRAILGIGAAWNELEHRAYGITLGDRKIRSDRFEEAAEICRSMLDRPQTTFSGTYYKLTDAANEPRPIQERLPILIGGGGETRTLRTTAQYADMWHGFGTVDQVAHKIEVLRQHCARVKRDPREILALGGGWVVVRDHPDDAMAYLERVAQHQGVERPIPRATGDPDTVARTLAEYARAGAGGFILSGAEPFDHETIERVGREVRPRLMRLLDA